MTASSALTQVARPDAPHWIPGYAELGQPFCTRLDPQPLRAPTYWVGRSDEAAALLGLDPGWNDDAMREVLAGNRPWPGTEAVATVYSGHQFGVWAGQLGDGRAHLLGTCRGPDGQIWEVQLKGSGRTPYSRMGDGRAVLRSSIREFLCSEAMAGLGIPTSRALAVVGSDTPVRRETMESAAVVTRLAPSFVRFGHFEHFCHTAPDPEHRHLRTLADHVIDAHLPPCRDSAQPYLALLEQACERTARMIAQWQCVGFCHGVMNTDNLSILGLTIDYGPFGFLDAFDPGHVCNHSDDTGRYAYNRQPGVALWNLHALAHALMPLIQDKEAVGQALERYREVFAQEMTQRMRARLGLAEPQESDIGLVEALLNLMAADRVDHTIAFRRLCDLVDPPQATGRPMRDLFLQREAFDAWAARYRARLAMEPMPAAQRAQRMRRVNPKYILRNHLAEQAIRSARQGDFSEVERLRGILSRPYDEQPAHEAYAGHPPEWAASLEISCSS